MKVVAINGSPRAGGNTAQALGIMADELNRLGVDTQIVQVGNQLIHGCIGCGHCRRSEGNKCVFADDCVNETAELMRQSDGFILGSPTYYGGVAGAMKCFLDRAFYSSSAYFRYKVATSVALVRRAGGEDVVHQLNNYLNLAQVVLPPSQYWTLAYGREKGEVLQDGEGIQTLRRNAQAMAWVMRLVEAGRDAVPLPEEEPRMMTNFIR